MKHSVGQVPSLVNTNEAMSYSGDQMSDHYDIPYPVDTGLACLAHTTLKYVHV